MDVINDGKNGFLVAPRAPELLAQKMQWVLERPDVASAVGREAQKTVENNFCVEKTIPLVEACYLNLYHQKQKGT